jgi:hypothetical protein
VQFLPGGEAREIPECPRNEPEPKGDGNDEESRAGHAWFIKLASTAVPATQVPIPKLAMTDLVYPALPRLRIRRNTAMAIPSHSRARSTATGPVSGGPSGSCCSAAVPKLLSAKSVAAIAAGGLIGATISSL